MYHPHASSWIIVAILFCCPAVLITVVIGWLRKRPFSSRLLTVLSVCFALSILVAVATQVYDNWQLRRELRAIQPDRIARLTLNDGKVSREICDPHDIASVLSQIQLVSFDVAHHTHPTDLLAVTFCLGRDQYVYRVGEDSERLNEFWVFNDRSSPETPMGRMHSPEWRPIVGALLRDHSGFTPADPTTNSAPQ